MTVRSQQIREFFFECDQCGVQSKPHADIAVAAAFATAQGFTVPDVTGDGNWVIEPVVCRKCVGDDVTTRSRTNGLHRDLGLSANQSINFPAFWKIAKGAVIGTVTPRTVKSVLRLRYSGDGDRIYTMETVARLLKVTQQRATQIITQCLRAMRDHVSEYTTQEDQE